VCAVAFPRSHLRNAAPAFQGRILRPCSFISILYSSLIVPSRVSTPATLSQYHAIRVSDIPRLSLSTMTSQSPFLRLPRELRDEIYNHYFRVENSYFIIHNLESLPVSMDTRLTCPSASCADVLLQKLMAWLLELNTINSFTRHCGASRERAGHFDTLIRTVASIKSNLLLCSAVGTSSLDQAVHEHLAKHFPLYLQIFLGPIPELTWILSASIAVMGEAPSLGRHFVQRYSI
jgi:hypothetical protein